VYVTVANVTTYSHLHSRMMTDTVTKNLFLNCLTLERGNAMWQLTANLGGATAPKTDSLNCVLHAIESTEREREK